MKIVLYSRRGCHLCEQVEEMLAAIAVETVVVDVDSSPGLAAAFGTRVPVVEVDGRVLIEGRFEERELMAVLARESVSEA
jgi:glutaredoxin